MVTRATVRGAARAGAAAAIAAGAALVVAGLGARGAIGAGAAVGAAVGAIAIEIGRTRGAILRRLDELEGDVAQTEALMALAARLPTRRPLPPMRGYAIAPDFALALLDLIDEVEPETIVETGSGVSTVILAYALERRGRGRVLALEHDPRYAARTRSLLAAHGLADRARVIDAPLEPTTIDGEPHRWHARAALAGLERVDLVVDDGPPRALGRMLRYASLPLFERLLAPRGAFVMDVIGDEERAILARWRARFPHLAFEVVDSKKGHAIARRRDDHGAGA